MDQKGARIGFIGGLDKVHQKAVESKKKRLEESELQQEKTSSSSQPDKKKLPLSEMGDIEDDIDDTDFIPSVQKAKKAYSVPLLVPRNITKAVALNSKTWKISVLPLPVNLALIIKKSGGDLDDFVVSTSTSRREGVKAVTLTTQTWISLTGRDWRVQCWSMRPLIP